AQLPIRLHRQRRRLTAEVHREQDSRQESRPNEEACRFHRRPEFYSAVLFGATICAVTKLKAVVLCVGLLGSTALVYSQAAPNRGDQGALELLPVQGNISMLAGAGGNITVQIGKDGVLLVDSGLAAMSDKVLEAIRTVSKGQITYIVNTSDR